MNEIVLRGRHTWMWVLVLVNLVVVAGLGSRWARGDPSVSTRVFTVVFALLLLVKLNAIRRPPEARLLDGRLSFRAGFMDCSTPRENLELLEVVGGLLRVRFGDLSKVEASPTLRKIFEGNLARGGVHFALPLRPDPAALQRLRAAVFAGR